MKIRRKENVIAQNGSVNERTKIDPQVPIRMRKRFGFGSIMTSPVIAVATGDVASNRTRKKFRTIKCEIK